MAIKLRELARWNRQTSGKELELPGQAEEARVIKIEFNTAAPTHIAAVEEYGTPRQGSSVFLAVIQGNETLEFTASGTVRLSMTSEEPVFYVTSDGAQIGEAEPDGESFVQLLERRTENERLILALERANRNYDALFEEQAAEIARLAAANGINPVTGEVVEQPPTVSPSSVPPSAPAPEPQPPANPAAAELAGGQSGTGAVANAAPPAAPA